MPVIRFRPLVVVDEALHERLVDTHDDGAPIRIAIHSNVLTTVVVHVDDVVAIVELVNRVRRRACVPASGFVGGR